MSKSNIENIYPLSPMQQGMLFHSLYDPEADVYVEQMYCKLVGGLDVDAFAAAWREVIQRHAILRTAYVWEDVKEPLQVVLRQVDLPLVQEDWRHLSSEAQEKRLHEVMEKARQSGFDLGKPPLMTLALYQITDDTHYFVWTHHHILFDGWSFPILLKEVFTLYEAAHQGRRIHLPPTRPFSDYIAWLKKQDVAQAEAYWRRTMAGFTAPTPLVVDKPLPEGAGDAGSRAEHELWLSAEVSEKLSALARQNQLTMSTLVQGAWALLLHRYSGEEDVLFGATVSGRPADLPGAEMMVGLFINTLPVRAQIDGSQSVRSWLKELQARQVEQRRYEYSTLVQIQEWSDAPRGVPLFESILVFENYPVDPAVATQRGSVHIEGLHSVERTNYPLTLVSAANDRIFLKISYDSTRFDADVIQRMLGHLRMLLEGMAATFDRPLRSLPMLTPEEKQQLLVDWNRTEVDFPAGATVVSLFAEQVARTPDATALVFEGEALSYAQLDARANQLAHRLLALGVQSGDLVGLFVEKSLEMVVGLFGILKAGAAYVPIDPDYPEERIRYMIDVSDSRLIITDTEARAQQVRGMAGAPQVLLLADPEWSGEPTHQPDIIVTPGQPAYIIFTSGSTGRPKGVVVPHRALANHAQAMIAATEMGPGDRMLQLISLSFDAAGEQFYPTLLSGATLVIPPSTLDLLGRELGLACEQEGITVLHMPAAVWHTVVDDLVANDDSLNAPLRLLMLGGDRPSVERLHAFTALMGRAIPFINLYGPTEATITSVFYRTSTDVTGIDPLPIGRPIANARVYVLDQEQRPVPVGVPGELYIGGAGLADGYLHQPQLTEQAFVENPFLPGDRLYRTGDLVRWLPDGNLVFLGRVDEQVKIRGFRVEPGEVEHVLNSLEIVQEAAVIVREDEPEQKRLVAYVVPVDGSDADIPAIREQLQARLPHYLVPAAFVVMAELPRMPSGKLDRRSLPAPDDGRMATGIAYVAPRTPEEELLVGIWQDVLSVEQVGVHDNFFDLGGHSLLATQLVSRVRSAFQVEIPLRTLFENPTIAQLARAIAEIRNSAEGVMLPPITPMERDEFIPLSFAQQRLWFLDQLEPGNLAYNIPTAVRLQGDLDVDALVRSMQEIVRRHEVLRTRFATEGGQPYQVIEPEIPLELPVIDLSELPEEERELEAQRQAAALVRQPFDLSTGPMLRGMLLRMGEDDHMAVMVMHHIVSDAWSIGIFINELTQLYQAFHHGQPSPLPDLPIQYADYAIWQQRYLQGEALEAQLDYWKEQLAGAPALLDIPTDRPRPPVQTSNGASYSFRLSPELSRRLQEVSRANGTTLFMTLLAGYQALLSRYSGQEDISVGSALASRTRAETEPLIGFFINTLVFRTDLSNDPSFRELLRRVREVALGAYAHQDVPFEMLVDALQPERDLSHSPLFQAAFSLQNIPVQARELEDLTVMPVELESGVAQFDLLLTMEEQGDSITGTMDYNVDLFDASTIERMMGHYQRLLQEAVTDLDRPVNRLPLLTPAEEELMLVTWNRTETPFPDAVTIHQLFEEQVAQRPHAPAVYFEDQVLSYGELDRRANQLAHYLQKLGVGPKTLVGVCTTRSPEMIIGILGTLKAGGAYLPLDPAYPAERLAYMIQDSRTPVLLTQSTLLDRLPDHNAVTVQLDREWDVIAQEPEEAPACEATADNLAYVIYTSGSTGRPKGTMLQHRGLCNLTDVQRRAFFLEEGKRVLQFSALSFDASVWEIFQALRNGAAICLAHQEQLASGPELVKLMQKHRITTATLPPSLLSILPEAQLPDLETLISAGEHCSGEIVARWAPGRQFFNAYGPTETTVCASMYLTDAEQAYPSGPPIGGPIANFKLYVLDSHLLPVPIGVPGELFIAGAGLARGYLNRPDLTAERFIPNPFVSEPGQRMYRTGDLVRWLPDGTIEFLGRIDHQVKVRGFRIELGEIEAVLRSHPQVDDAVVLARTDTPGDTRLVGYVVAHEGESPSVSDLRAWTRTKLPEYMVPAFVIILDGFPLTPSGKVDRKALPAPDASRPQQETPYVAPRTPAEEKLAAMAADLLGLERVGVEDNFFELGGHSLLATQFISRVRDEFGVEVPLRRLFESPTVAGIAAAVEEAKTAGPQPQRPSISRASRSARRVKRSDLKK